MEDIEQAVQSQAILDEYAIEAIRRKVGKTLLHTGFCYYCNEAVHSPHLYCDIDCREDWEKEQRLKQIAGKRTR